MITNATAVHEVAMVGLFKEIIIVKIIMETKQPTAHQIMIGRRPNRSMVDGKGYVPIAKPVFMTAASSCERKGEYPMFAKILVL